MKIRTAIVSFSVAGLVLAGATTLPAQADLVTRCVGTGGAVTVPGDLVVPKGASCLLTGTTVEGKVTVGADADLVATDATFKGAVLVGENGYLDVFNTTIAASVVSRGGYGVYLETSTVAGAVRGLAPKDTSIDPFTFVIGTAVAKSVSSVSGELLIEDSQIAGNVTGDGTTYTDVVNSSLNRGLTVTGNDLGSAVCSSEVLGNVTYEGNGDGVQLGDGALFDACDQVNYFGGNVTINNTTGGVQLNGNIIQGDLTGDGNDPAPVGDHNRVRGLQGGQFADLAPAPQAEAHAKGRAETQSQPTSTTQDRVVATTAKAQHRKAAATAGAEKAGSADL